MLGLFPASPPGGVRGHVQCTSAPPPLDAHLPAMFPSGRKRMENVFSFLVSVTNMGLWARHGVRKEVAEKLRDDKDVKAVSKELILLALTCARCKSEMVRESVESRHLLRCEVAVSINSCSECNSRNIMDLRPYRSLRASNAWPMSVPPSRPHSK